MSKCTSKLEMSHRYALRQRQARMRRDLPISDLQPETRDMGQPVGFFAIALWHCT